MNYKWWLFIAIFLFGGGLVLGLATPSSISSPFSENVDTLEKFAGILAPLPKPSVLVFIFVKNVSAILISFVLSPIFCLPPVLALVVNGWLVGFVSTTVVQQKSVGYLLAGLLPHGIFELPALIMGEAVALSFGITVMLAIFKKEGRSQLRTNLKKNLKYLAIALVLFLPAAIIETYVTPLFLR